MFYVYVLLCSNAKWYVGATRKKPETRFAEHLNGKFGAAWCRKHPPIRIVQKTKYSSELEMLTYEKLTTFEMMKKKGYEQVRGANFCQLAPVDVKQLAWDMAQLTGDDARKLIKNLRPDGPIETKFKHLVIDVPSPRKGYSKYFL